MAPESKRRLGEFEGQAEDENSWDETDYFGLLTDCAMRGLEMLGAPDPEDLISLLQVRGVRCGV